MRGSGILMHISSLPSPHGIGTFGATARNFVTFLEKAGQTYWQILPLGQTSFGDSPYMSFSAYAGNPYFIDLDTLVEQGYLNQDEIANVIFSADDHFIDYGRMYETRYPVLKKAASRFDVTKPEYVKFCEDNAFWLDDYACFMALKDAHAGRSFEEWEEPLRRHDKVAVAEFAADNKERLEFYRILQYWFFEQWFALKEFANAHGIKIIGDIPIYIARDSADLWSQPMQFALDEDLKPIEIAGCPPDAFSADGQVWGNPLYDWEYMASDGFSWWVSRVRHSLKLYDLVRIDHFRGFDTYWCIPAGDTTAKNGVWREGPGMKLFNKLSEELGEGLPIIAEDLGMLLPSVHKLLADSGFPGMKVLQFAFDPDADSTYLPYKYEKNCVVYTGTHDNDTIMGWLNDPANKTAAEYAKRFMRLNSGEGAAWGMIKTAFASNADTCILTMQDIIGLGSEARMNKPSTIGENWKWRIDASCINDWLANVLHEFTEIYRRLPEQNVKPKEEIKQ